MPRSARSSGSCVPTPAPIEVAIPRGATTIEVAQLLSSEKDVIGSDPRVPGIRAWSAAWTASSKPDGTSSDRRWARQAALDVLFAAPIEKGTSVRSLAGFTLQQVAERLAQHEDTCRGLPCRSQRRQRPRVDPTGGREDVSRGSCSRRRTSSASANAAADIARRMVARVRPANGGPRLVVSPSRADCRKYEALIIASLVEREARVAEDRAKVSAVIYNRLAKRMRLQIDITALYGLDEHKVPTRADLQRASPYNTYLIDGLPPTPIANPGPRVDQRCAASRRSIDAIYYVVIDPSGKHGFTERPAGVRASEATASTRGALMDCAKDARSSSASSDIREPLALARILGRRAAPRQRNAVYVAFDVRPEDFDGFVAGMRVAGARGFNVTLPHKTAAFEMATGARTSPKPRVR